MGGGGTETLLGRSRRDLRAGLLLLLYLPDMVFDVRNPLRQLRGFLNNPALLDGQQGFEVVRQARASVIEERNLVGHLVVVPDGGQSALETFLNLLISDVVSAVGYPRRYPPFAVLGRFQTNVDYFDAVAGLLVAGNGIEVTGLVEVVFRGERRPLVHQLLYPPPGLNAGPALAISWIFFLNHVRVYLRVFLAAGLVYRRFAGPIGTGKHINYWFGWLLLHLSGAYLVLA